nr:hypothetical protein [Spirochaetota bacterium]
AKARSDLVTTIISIIDLSDQKLLKMYKDYIAEFDSEKAMQVDAAIGFYPGKPGRPKKPEPVVETTITVLSNT